VSFKKVITGLLLLDLAILMTGYSLTAFTAIMLPLSDILILTFCYSVIAAISLFIFCKREGKDPGSQTIHILVAITVKMLLEMVLALIWFQVLKKTYPFTVLIFFILYLAYSLYSLIFMLNTLKRKSL
jgi:hypothetical protein